MTNDREKGHAGVRPEPLSPSKERTGPDERSLLERSTSGPDPYQTKKERRMIRERLSRITAGIFVAAIAVLALAASASAHTGEWAAFNYCPSTNAEAFKCIKSVTNGGEIVLGKKTVPIVHPVTLQGGLT